ncbi:MAG: WbqC family protein [Saprospiraceae bacterium]|nr:WbqC family protein [Saprospiraceae bacterium]
MNKIVAIHQPNYFPWIGYFFKIYVADEFVFLNNIKHSKKYPTRRTFVPVTKEYLDKKYLTIPLQKHSDFTVIHQLKIDNSKSWRASHVNYLLHTYARTPQFRVVFPLIKSWFREQRTEENLSVFNQNIILNICKYLNINKKFESDLNLDLDNNLGDINLSICKKLGATHYLSGQGGLNYQDEHQFLENNIQLLTFDIRSYMDNLRPFRQQKSTSFMNGLSIIDILMYLSADEICQLLENAKSSFYQNLEVIE